MKIALVGASGYGNVGDDTYPKVFAAQVPEAKWHVFNSDLPRSMPEGIDALILGGGGVLHNVGELNKADESPHFLRMKFYLDWAEKRGIPWGVVSCGFQFRAVESEPYEKILRPWIPYLKRARCITLRSPVCRKIAEEITGRSDIQFFPDLAYLYRPPGFTAPPVENLLTVVPAGALNPRNAFTQHFVRLFQSMNYRVQWLGMGAERDDEGHLKEALAQFPGTALINQPGPEPAFREIARSRMVISGRYHGMVFARSLGIPFFVSQDAPHKIRSEDWTTSPLEAGSHLQVLRSLLPPFPG